MGEPRADHCMSGEEDEVGDEILEEFRTLFVPRRGSLPRRKSLSVNTEKAKLLESCLDDLDKDKDDMLQVVKLELAKALRHAQESEQRSGEFRRQAENFQHDVHALVDVLSAAFHSGQWKFASADFRTVSDGMLPAAGTTSKEATRASWHEKQLAERGRQIQSLQQELVSGSARHRVLQEQVAKRDSDLADMRDALASSQERASAVQQELERSEKEAGERHSVLIAEVKQRDELIESLQAENARLQQHCNSTAKSSLASADQVNTYQQEVAELTKSLMAEKSHSAQLADDLVASKETADNLTQQLSSQETRVDDLLQRLNLQVGDLQSNVSVVEAQYKTACAETEAAQAELSNCTRSLQNAQADASMYHEQLLDSRAKVEQWEASVQLMRSEHAAEISRREKIIQDLEVRLQASETEKDSLAEDLQHRGKTIEMLEGECRSKTIRYRWQLAMKSSVVDQLRAQSEVALVALHDSQSRLRSCEESLASVKTQLQASQTEVEEVNGVLTRTQDEFTCSLEQFHSEKVSSDAVLQDLHTQLTAMGSKLEASTNNVSDLEEGNSQLRDALNSSQAALTACQEQLNEEREATDALRLELESVKAELARVCQDKEALKEEILSRDDLANSLRQQLANVSQHSTSQAEHHRKSYDDLMQLHRDVNERLQAALNEVNEKAESLSSLSSQAQQLHAEKLALQEKYIKDHEELGVVQVEVETSREETKLCHRRIVQLEEDQSNLRTELAGQRGELDLREKQISVLRDSHQTLTTTIDSLKGRLLALDELECTKATLESEVAHLQSELKTLKKTVESKDNSLEQVNVKLGELEAERARLADMVQARDREVSRLTQNQVADISQGEKIENLELQLLELKDEMSSVNTKLRKSQDEAAEWKNTCEANESTVNRFKAECDRIRGLLVLKTEELQSAKDQAAEVEREQRRLLQEIQAEKDLALQLQTEVNSLRDHHHDAEDSLRREVETMKCSTNYMATADRLSSELDEVNREVIQLRRSLAAAEEGQDKLTAQLRVSQDTCARLESKCGAAELAAQRARAAADSSSLLEPSGEEIELRHVKQSNDYLTAELNQRQNAVDGLRRDVDELKSHHRSTTHELKLKQLRLRQLEQDIEAQRIQNTTLKEKIMSHERCQTMLEEALERSQGDSVHVSDKTDGVVSTTRQQHDSSSLSSEAHSGGQLHHHREAVKESLSRELESLKCGANYMATADRLSSELDEVNREVIQLRRSLASSEEEHDQLTAKFRASQDTCARLELKCEAAEQSAHLAREVADSSSLSGPSGDEIELRQIKQTNEFLTAELSQRQNVIDVLRRDVDELKSHHRATTHELKLKQLRTRQLEQDVEAQRIQNTTLKEKIMAHERRQTLLEVALERSQEERANLSDKIDSFVAASSRPQGSSALALKAKSLDQQVSELKLELDSCNGVLRHVRQLYEESLTNLEACERKRQAQTEVLEKEIEALRSERDVGDGTHKQLVSQLQTTVNTLGEQLDRVILDRSGNGEDGIDNGDEDDERSSLSQSRSFSSAMLLDAAVTQLETKCGTLQSELLSARRLNSSMRLQEQQRIHEHQQRFDQERSMLKDSLVTVQKDLMACRQDLITKDRKIFQLSRSLDRAESSRLESLRKVDAIEGSLQDLNSRRKPDSNGSFGS